MFFNYYLDTYNIKLIKQQNSFKILSYFKVSILGDVV